MCRGLNSIAQAVRLAGYDYLRKTVKQEVAISAGTYLFGLFHWLKYCGCANKISQIILKSPLRSVSLYFRHSSPHFFFNDVGAALFG